MIATGRDMRMGCYLIWLNARTRLNAVIEQLSRTSSGVHWWSGLRT